MAQQQLRKRGANYTPEEKSLLLDLVMQYKHIVECKRTGGTYIKKKREAWDAITLSYNANSSSGPRDTDQLKSLYDNMKQKSRKELGESNKLAYINNAEHIMVTNDDVAHAIKKIKEDKIEINKTGGGFWKPKMTDNEAKVLAIIQDQVEPLSNAYDSAAGFFKDSVILTYDNSITGSYASPSCSKTQEITLTATAPLPSENMVVEVDPPLKIAANSNKKNAFKQRKIIKTTSAEALKKLYFKKKCQNADLEKKKLMMEILHMKREHDLKMIILKNKVNNAEYNV